MFGGHLAFLSPALLGFLGALPILWWLLRLTPPTPRKIFFPALLLLRDLTGPEKTPARSPWWLLFLRLLTAAVLIIAFAQPVLDPQSMAATDGDLFIAVDNDWASARHWDLVQEAMHDLIHDAERNNRSVYLLPTTPSADGESNHIIGPLAAKAAYMEAQHLRPMPWPAAWAEAAKLLAAMVPPPNMRIVWLASGLGGADAHLFYQTLQSLGPTHVRNDEENPIYLLQSPQIEDDATSIAVLRAATEKEAALSIAALGRDGQTLARMPLEFKAGSPRAATKLDLPLDIRNQTTRFVIEGSRSAGATVLLDAGWEHRAVGLVGDKAELDRHSFTSDVFYIDRALKPYADLHIDALDALLKQNIAVLILPDAVEIKESQIPQLEDWIKRGGILVRFAGERLAAMDDPKQAELLPVTLRSGDRSMGGTLSWATPLQVQDFPAGSPFRGLSPAPDVTVSRQILAEPSADLVHSTWAALADGTPFVTAKPLGQGLSILFHVPARSDWSNLPLSGLFVDMLRRIIDLARSNANATDFTDLPPLRMLDGFGDEQKPGAAAQPLIGDGKDILPDPHHPPGLYGTDGYNRAFNLGAALTQPETLTGVPTETYAQTNPEKDLQSPLLIGAFLLLLIDFVLSLSMRGHLVLKRRNLTASILIALCLVAFQAQAANNDKEAVELSSKTYLAYVITGDREIDRISDEGLVGLARVVQRRTSIDEIAVTGINPDTDDLAFFPFIYWPITAHAAPLSNEAAQRVDDYLHHGGMILFDTLTGEAPSPLLMKKALAGLDIPPLALLPQDHVLKRSFYLLDDFPGRYANTDFWLEPEDMSNYDGVATVLIGNNDWAAAWAVDESGRPLFPCTPGGEAQRERSYRFGINLLMYAMTGNYKNDQIHAQELLKRIGK